MNRKLVIWKLDNNNAYEMLSKPTRANKAIAILLFLLLFVVNFIIKNIFISTFWLAGIC